MGLSQSSAFPDKDMCGVLALGNAWNERDAV